MESPIEASRRDSNRDRSGSATGNRSADISRLIADGSILALQGDRQVDIFDSPAIPAGGSASPTPFQIVDVSTGGITPAAAIQVLYGMLYSPTLGTSIDVTLGGVSLTLAPSLPLGGVDTYYIYLDTDLMSVATVQNSTTPPPTDDPSTPETYCLLGVVTVVTSGTGTKVGTIMQAITSSLSAVICSDDLTFCWSTL